MSMSCPRASEPKERRVDFAEEAMAARFTDVIHGVLVLVLLEPAVEDVGEFYLVACRAEQLPVLLLLEIAGL